ncbi:YicC/YloC family endoribonuclease [Elongatibacter sediminis]|uniref:YicC/YloC family endoribonuclease n=1 Tax=Elongatibacter sediminis TaxID=3119006 RepID=A0AAW9RKK8_9GAMM
MTHSMTGFATAEQIAPAGRLTWELRSVNHRYLEISLRVPEEFRVLEPDVREVLGSRLSRGKIDANLRFTPDPAARSNELNLNAPLAEHLLELHDRLQGMAGLKQEPDLGRLLNWPGLVVEQPPDPGPLHDAAMQALADALIGLSAAREREGRKLAALIRERLDGVAEQGKVVRGLLPEIRASLEDKLLKRVADLPLPLEPGRMEQEVTLMLQKIDVAEELDRLDAHVSEARRALELDKPVGRRLDFLMQEFNRESNTLSSKSVDARTTQAAVELKVLIEQMREQVQNIE